jgi:hypothetical protein
MGIISSIVKLLKGEADLPKLHVTDVQYSYVDRSGSVHANYYKVDSGCLEDEQGNVFIYKRRFDESPLAVYYNDNEIQPLLHYAERLLYQAMKEAIKKDKRATQRRKEQERKDGLKILKTLYKG